MLKRIPFLLIVFAIILSGCQPSKQNGFAIFLLADKDLPASDLVKMDINQLTIESEPIISSVDIISYDKVNHKIELTQAAITRIQKIFPMPIKVGGIPFVVCVGKERIYTGAFWTPLSSLSYDGVAIMQPLSPAETTIQITLGYPSRDFFTGNDPRTDPRIMKTLEQSKKLK